MKLRTLNEHKLAVERKNHQILQQSRVLQRCLKLQSDLRKLLYQRGPITKAQIKEYDECWAFAEKEAVSVFKSYDPTFEARP
jgi:hypothetical protein